MKVFIIAGINFYQQIVSVLLRNLFGIRSSCRFPVSCSVYAKKMILCYGTIKGGRLSIVRLLHCQPFSKTYV